MDWAAGAATMERPFNGAFGRGGWFWGGLLDLAGLARRTTRLLELVLDFVMYGMQMTSGLSIDNWCLRYPRRAVSWHFV